MILIYLFLRYRVSMLPMLTLNYWAQCSLLLGLQTHSIVLGIDTLTRRLCNQVSLSLLSTASGPSPTAYLEEFEHLVGALEPSLNTYVFFMPVGDVGKTGCQ